MGLRDGPKPIIHHLILQISYILEQTIQLLQVAVSQGDGFCFDLPILPGYKLDGRDVVCEDDYVGHSPRDSSFDSLQWPFKDGFFAFRERVVSICFHESVVLVLVSGFQELIWHRR